MIRGGGDLRSERLWRSSEQLGYLVVCTQQKAGKELDWILFKQGLSVSERLISTHLLT